MWPRRVTPGVSAIEGGSMHDRQRNDHPGNQPTAQRPLTSILRSAVSVMLVLFLACTGCGLTAHGRRLRLLWEASSQQDLQRLFAEEAAEDSTLGSIVAREGTPDWILEGQRSGDLLLTLHYDRSGNAYEVTSAPGRAWKLIRAVPYQSALSVKARLTTKSGRPSGRFIGTACSIK